MMSDDPRVERRGGNVEETAKNLAYQDADIPEPGRDA